MNFSDLRFTVNADLTPNKTDLIKRAGRLELELFSMLCSYEIFTDQSYHAWIRSELNSSIRSDACTTPDYVSGQPASVCIASRRQRGERQGHPEGSRAAARWLGKYSTGTTVLDLPVQ